MAITLEAKTRDIVGKKVFSLRQENKIPAVFYGRGSENKNIVVEYVPFEKVYQEAGENTIIDLVIDGTTVKALIGDVAYEPLKGSVAHVDFKQVRMDEEITATVSLEFVGESKVVKEDGGVLVKNIDELEIQCLPANLIHEVVVDISSLNTFDDVITIKDLKVPNTVEILGHEPEDVVVMVSEPKAEEEAPAPAPAAEAAAAPAENKEAAQS